MESIITDASKKKKKKKTQRTQSYISFKEIALQEILFKSNKEWTSDGNYKIYCNFPELFSPKEDVDTVHDSHDEVRRFA